MPGHSIDEYQNAQRQQKKLFKECFGTPAGKEVLQALREEFYDCYISEEANLSYRLGQRDVIFQILAKVDEI